MPDVDAYLVLYSVADNKSFQHAENKLASLNKDLKRETAVILVANKSDIVRNRTVTADGKCSFPQSDCNCELRQKLSQNGPLSCYDGLTSTVDVRRYSRSQ